jgi:hypothetical protein
MKITVPMVVLAVGLATGARVMAQPAPSAGANTHSTTVLSDGTREVRVESDGTTARVKLDGNLVATLDMAGDWTHHKVTGPDGTVVATVWRAGPGSASLSAALGDHDGPMQNRMMSTQQWKQRGVDWAQRLEGIMADEEVQAQLSQAREEMERALSRVGREMPRVMIGVTMNPTAPEAVQSLGYEALKTATIESVVEGGPAAKAGLTAGDVIVGFDGGASADAEAIRDALKDNNPGDSVAVTYVRDGKAQATTIALEPYNPSVMGFFGRAGGGPGQGTALIDRLMLTDDEIDRIQGHIAELSTQLETMASELATAVGARAQELSKLSAEVGAQIAQQAAELARRSAAQWSTRIFSPGAAGQGQTIVRVVPDGQGGSQDIIVYETPSAPAAPGAPAPPPAPAGGTQTTEMQERLDRLEATNAELKAMLEQLLRQQRENAGGNR